MIIRKMTGESNRRHKPLVDEAASVVSMSAKIVDNNEVQEIDTIVLAAGGYSVTLNRWELIKLTTALAEFEGNLR